MSHRLIITLPDEIPMEEVSSQAKKRGYRSASDFRGGPVSAVKKPAKASGEGLFIVWDTLGNKNVFDIKNGGLAEYTRGKELFDKEMAKFRGTDYVPTEVISNLPA